MDCLIENERLMYSLGCIRRPTVYVHVPMYIYKICAQKYAPICDSVPICAYVCTPVCVTMWKQVPIYVYTSANIRQAHMHNNA